MAGVGSILLQPDVTLARSKSGEKGAVSRSWVRPTHVTMGRELADARFSKGNWWMWQYSDGEGKPYSWERYRRCLGLLTRLGRRRDPHLLAHCVPGPLPPVAECKFCMLSWGTTL